jgi:hypothetical protein
MRVNYRTVADHRSPSDNVASSVTRSSHYRMGSISVAGEATMPVARPAALSMAIVNAAAGLAARDRGWPHSSGLGGNRHGRGERAGQCASQRRRHRG